MFSPNFQGCRRVRYESKWKTMRSSYRGNGKSSAKRLKEVFAAVNASSGSFTGAFPCPRGAEPEKAKATFRNGVLEIIMPAPKQKAERQQIQIEADTKAPPASETASSVETKQAAA